MDLERAAAWLLAEDTEVPPPTCVWILCDDGSPMPAAAAMFRWSIMGDGVRLGVGGAWGWAGPPGAPLWPLSCEESAAPPLA